MHLQRKHLTQKSNNGFYKTFLIYESIDGEITALSGTEIPDADEHRFDIILIDLDTNPEKAVETAEVSVGLRIALRKWYPAYFRL